MQIDDMREEHGPTMSLLMDLAEAQLDRSNTTDLEHG